MKNSLFKSSIIAIITAFTIISCVSKSSGDPSTLPKDISERPADENNQKYETAALEKIKIAIESEIAKEKCTRNADWTFAPIGSKACGGPTGYIAYPKKIETEILPKIESYNQRMSDFNKKYNITSDCMMAPEPTSVRCENGKGVLVF
ncbi:hypothetical protein [Chryseobacterium sp. GP-SGM7]|uniref:hypothetical protein n=1 Tax=Chryseobacterium sp. GP-SGM7 TaxID=3411323 RepID=UPI003B952CCB